MQTDLETKQDHGIRQHRRIPIHPLLEINIKKEFMKIEYLPEAHSVHPKDSILRVYDFDTQQACQFRDILSKLSNDLISEFNLSDLPFVTSVDGCHLLLKVARRDEGILQMTDTDFECKLTKMGWENAVELIECFCAGHPTGYQWLYNEYTDIQFLFSADGDW